MKYESEILYDLMKRDGLLNPSQNHLPYESELKEKYVNDVVGAYPKLQDYRAEWLNYALEDGVGEFPYVTLTDVTNATIDNVVPYAYKSAILSGNTLVNLCDKTKSVFSSSGNKNLWQNALINTNPTQLTIINFTDKVIKYSVNNRTNDNWVSTNKVDANSKLLVNCGTDNYLKDLYGAYGDGWSNTEEDMDILKNGILVLEGDHTQEDIPYFEGMQSIQMPVLTTTGKNLFDKNKLEKGELQGNGEPVGNDVRCRTSDFIQVKGGSKLTLSKSTNEWIRIFGYDNNKNYVGSIINKTSSSETFAIPSKVCFIKIKFDYTIDIAMVDNIQLEVGNKATSYEPYKSNILTVNEDVTLRGIGEVQDTLDCLTGEVTERIREFVLNGSEPWESHAEKTNTKVFKLIINSIKNVDHHIISDRFPTNAAGDVEKITNTSNVVYLAILKTKANNLNDLKSYLSQNPLTVQFQRAKESIKTVDLMITNQNGESLSKMTPIEGTMNLTTSSDTIAPTFTGEIPVEAIEQNLASFANLEGVEHNE